jgi:hypothetical protein
MFFRCAFCVFILSVLCFRLFVNIFVLKRENKRENEKVLLNKAIIAGTRGNGLEIAERLEIAIDVAHAITYLHMYSGMQRISIKTWASLTLKN